MRYVRTKIAEDEEQLSYKKYMSEALMAVAENTARFAGGNHMTISWWEHHNQEVDIRTGNEIISDVMREAGIKFANE